ncbi:Scarecrow-like protein 7 [Heracleum sosnowskyi]|uniref:Scarecrow-like protein 7 n=1 Tax=Heracleum sosnowskyi TaxID=360622 RepID=A0AAD8LYW2_9APIA|nr:Scarecrow-like protein 7 [Heracleum sosnowskyi]
MAGIGGFAVSRSHGGDRFYNPPAIRRHQQLLLQQQLRRPEKSPAAEVPEKLSIGGDVVKRSDCDEVTSALSKATTSGCESLASESNVDRLIEAVTPCVAAHYCAEVNDREWKSREAGLQPFYHLRDLWESMKEWSAFGAGVPLIIKGTDSVIQYYVPYLSGVQIYIDPLKRISNIKHPCEKSNVESLKVTISGSSTDLNSQKLKRLSLKDKSPMNTSGGEGEITAAPGLLVFEYLEHEQPYSRRPLTDKISSLEAQFTELSSYRSCDLLPSSWISIAWYPIYRIPMGSTLKDLDASFLTIHPLSTHSRNGGQSHSQSSSCVAKVIGASSGSSKISLPVIGLASYKYKGSILSPSGPQDYDQENLLLEAANSWLQGLKVVLPDFQFFRSHHYSSRR